MCRRLLTEHVFFFFVPAGSATTRSEQKVALLLQRASRAHRPSPRCCAMLDTRTQAMVLVFLSWHVDENMHTHTLPCTCTSPYIDMRTCMHVMHACTCYAHAHIQYTHMHTHTHVYQITPCVFAPRDVAFSSVTNIAVADSILLARYLCTMPQAMRYER